MGEARGPVLYPGTLTGATPCGEGLTLVVVGGGGQLVTELRGEHLPVSLCPAALSIVFSAVVVRSRVA